MDSDPVSSSLSSFGGSGGNVSAAPPFTYTETFDKMFPYYLAIGMTEEQYWDRDCNLAKAYRKARKIKINQQNEQAWLQGAYFYDALCRVSPIFRSLAKKGTKAAPYMDEPIAIFKDDYQDRQIKKEKQAMDKNKAFLEAFAAKFNKKFEKDKTKP